MKTLRADQTEAIENLRTALRESQKKRVIVQGPTGSGKTVIMADIVGKARERDKKVLITVPAISLIDQTVIALATQGLLDVGVIQADHPKTDWSRPIQVASIQTLQHRWREGKMPAADVVLVDEVHRRFDLFSHWIVDPKWLKIPFIGFSATPWSKGLGILYEQLLVANTIAKLIAQSVLVPFRTFAPDMPDLAGVRSQNDVNGTTDFVAADLDEVMRPKKLVANIVETWKQLAFGRPTVCFCCSRAHADQVAKEFEASGVGAAYLDCETPLPDRNEVRRRMLRGEVEVVTNCEVIGIGVDWPEVSCIIYARPTMSDIRFCLDSQTEILTSHGWRGMGQVQEGDCVATMADLETGRGQWSRVIGVIEREMTEHETWVEYHGPQSDFRVTDQHRMIFAERPAFRRRGFVEQPYEIAPAQSLLRSNESKRIPAAVRMDQPGVPLTDAELYFIGIMMTDGTWRARSGGISQSERHPEIIERIERCLRDCDIAFSKRRIPTPAALHSAASGFHERHARWQYSLSFGKPIEGLAKPRRGEHLNAIKHGYERVPGNTGFAHLLPFLDKDFAPALMALSRSQFLVLLQGIHDGDGHKMKSPSIDWVPRSWTLCSARKMFVERLQAIAVINGFGSHLHPEPRGKNPLYVLTITPKDWRSIGGYGERVAIEIKPGTRERVWCVETETGTIVTRRRGKVMVMGNCQNIGRGLRACEGKEDLLILDHSTTTLRLGFVDEVYNFHNGLDDGKPKPENVQGVSLPKECPACHLLKPPRTATCPHCGHTCEAHAKPVLVERGTLREISSIRDPKAELLKKLPDKQHCFGQLWWWGHKKGYKPGWAAVKTKELFESFPRAREPDPEMISEPVPELLKWVLDSTDRWKARQDYQRRKERAFTKLDHAVNGGLVTDRQPPKGAVANIDQMAKQFTPGTLMSEDDWGGME